MFNLSCLQLISIFMTPLVSFGRCYNGNETIADANTAALAHIPANNIYLALLRRVCL